MGREPPWVRTTFRGFTIGLALGFLATVLLTGGPGFLLDAARGQIGETRGSGLVLALIVCGTAGAGLFGGLVGAALWHRKRQDESVQA